MSALSRLLERFRRLRLPPGAAAGIVAVPSAGEELSGEVGFLFEELDQIDARAAELLSSARAEAEEIVAKAKAKSQQLLADGKTKSDQHAAQLLAERRADWERQANSILEEAETEAGRVLARGRERIPPFVDRVIERLLGGTQ